MHLIPRPLLLAACVTLLAACGGDNVKPTPPPAAVKPTPTAPRVKVGIALGVAVVLALAIAASARFVPMRRFVVPVSPPEASPEKVHLAA